MNTLDDTIALAQIIEQSGNFYIAVKNVSVVLNLTLKEAFDIVSNITNNSLLFYGFKNT